MTSFHKMTCQQLGHDATFFTLVTRVSKLIPGFYTSQEPKRTDRLCGLEKDIASTVMQKEFTGYFFEHFVEKVCEGITHLLSS